MVARVLGRVAIKGEKSKGGWILDCGTSEGRKAVMILDQWQVGGSTLKITHYNQGMSLQEMFKWVTTQIEFLESEEPYRPGFIHQTTVEGAAPQTHPKVAPPTTPRPGSFVTQVHRPTFLPTHQPTYHLTHQPTYPTTKPNHWSGKGKGFSREASQDRRGFGKGNTQLTTEVGKGEPKKFPWVSVGKGGRGVYRQPNKSKCWTCQAQGKPDNHYYRECPAWLAEKGQRTVSESPGSSPKGKKRQASKA